MAAAHKHLACDVLLAPGHRADAAAAAVLRVIRIGRKALDIAEIRQREHALLFRDQIFDIDLARDRRDFRAARVGKLALNFLRLVLDNRVDARFMRENVAQVGDARLDLRELALEFFALQARQSAQRHLDDCLRLHVVQAKAFGQTLPRGRPVGAVADDRDDLVDMVDGNLQTLQDVCARQGLF